MEKQQQFGAKQAEAETMLKWMLMLMYAQPNTQLRPKCFKKRKKKFAACSDFRAH